MNLDSASAVSQILITAVELLGIIFAGIKFFNKITSRLDKLDEIDDRIKKVESQYVPNGGSSMRDAVNRIEREVTRVQERLDNHIDNNRD
jgi:hypothetical protein